jgi:hypothetical protein
MMHTIKNILELDIFIDYMDKQRSLYVQLESRTRHV